MPYQCVGTPAYLSLWSCPGNPCQGRLAKRSNHLRELAHLNTVERKRSLQRLQPSTNILYCTQLHILFQSVNILCGFTTSQEIFQFLLAGCLPPPPSFLSPHTSMLLSSLAFCISSSFCSLTNLISASWDCVRQSSSVSISIRAASAFSSATEDRRGREGEGEEEREGKE